MKPILPLLISATLLVSGCNTTENRTQSSQISTKAKITRAETAFLSEPEAMARSQRVSNVDYVLNFQLTGQPTFSATAEVGFELKDVEQPLTLDLDQAQIQSLSINGNKVEAKYNQWFITLDPQYLHRGHNTVAINYSRKHSTNGEGLHRFEDPVDGKVYLYSHFEPAAAQQMFPAFDQPDIKATYTLTVSAPKDWYVLSAEPEQLVKTQGEYNHWKFAKTPLLSTYNFSLHAGPYKMWQDTTGKYPLRLFARQSVAEQISPQMWFKFSHQGFGFFEKYFDIPYPFKKYDQVLVPDFLYGAMENAGAVTFDERSFLTGGTLSQAQQEDLATTILHEMAHQWFGNLVTMKWWNGLWLNESFAAFMHNHSTAEATEFDYAWRSFYSTSKQYAYFLDQLVTTHPIEVPIASTANAFDNIDGITYAKGAAVLRQLNFLLGAENFRQGVHNYLTQYSYKNATLDDFIESLSKASGRDLSQWKQQWLYQPGTNTITADYSCENGKISRFTLVQDAPTDHPVWREQRVNIGLFKLDAQGQVTFSRAEPITYNGKQSKVDALIGNECPDLVYPNYQDWGFVKVNLDQKSFATVKSSINTVSDPLLRAMLWKALDDSVHIGKLPLNEYIDVWLANAPTEKDYTILRQLGISIRGMFTYLNKFGDSAKPYRDGIAEKLEKQVWQAIEHNRDAANLQQLWFDTLVTNAITPFGQNRIYQVLQGEITLSNVDVHQDLRWDIIASLSRSGFAQAKQLIDAEKQLDKSDNGDKRAIAAMASLPDPKQKQFWLAQLSAEQSEYPFPKLRAAMGSLFPDQQGHLVELFADDILAGLATQDETKAPLFMRTYGRRVIPSTCSEQNLERLNKAVEELKTLSTISSRALLLAQYSNQQCVDVLRKFKQ